MKYKRLFVNNYLHITLNTNSKEICELIENILDFPKQTKFLSKKIKIVFNLKYTFLGEKCLNPGFNFKNRVEKDGSLSSYFGTDITDVKTDKEKGIVNAVIAGDMNIFSNRIFYYIFSEPLHYILSHHGFYFLHTAAIAKNNECLLIAGGGNCGKSTISLVLAKNGYKMLCDDDCFFKTSSSKELIFPFPTKAGINKGLLKAYPQFKNKCIKNYSYGGKNRISLQRVFKPENLKEGYVCRVILFPKYKPKANLQIKKISYSKAIKRLSKDSPASSCEKEFQKMFWSMCSLTKSADCFELIYDDESLKKIPAIIKKIF